MELLVRFFLLCCWVVEAFFVTFLKRCFIRLIKKTAPELVSLVPLWEWKGFLIKLPPNFSYFEFLMQVINSIIVWIFSLWIELKPKQQRYYTTQFKDAHFFFWGGGEIKKVTKCMVKYSSDLSSLLCAPSATLFLYPFYSSHFAALLVTYVHSWVDWLQFWQAASAQLLRSFGFDRIWKWNKIMWEH